MFVSLGIPFHFSFSLHSSERSVGRKEERVLVDDVVVDLVLHQHVDFSFFFLGNKCGKSGFERNKVEV